MALSIPFNARQCLRRNPSAMRVALDASWRIIARGVAVGIVWEVTVALVPLFTQQAIDQGLVPRDWDNLTFWLVVLLVDGLAMALLSSLRHLAATEASSRATLRLRAYLMRHLLSLDARFHDRSDRGDVLTRATADVTAIGNFMDSSITAVSHAVSIILIITFLMLLDPILGLIGLAFVPLLLFLMGITYRLYESRIAAMREATGHLTSALHETIFGIRVIKGLGLEARQNLQYLAASDNVRQRAMSVIRLDSIYEVMGSLLPAMALTAGLWWGGSHPGRNHGRGTGGFWGLDVPFGGTS